LAVKPHDDEPSNGAMIKTNLLLETAERQRAAILVLLIGMCLLLAIIAGILLFKA
jgi:hypothetical protein